jgi:cold shock CspA family protein
VTQGVVKVYDPVSGAGIIVTDTDKTEVFLRPGSLQGSIFRTLRQGQRLVFDMVDEDDRPYASNLRMGQDGY